MLQTVIFYFFAAVLVGAGLGVITSRNPVHSALYLVLAFFTSAVLWLLMEAEFLAIALVLVYVGAVMVLFLFVVMMLDINVARVREGFTRFAPLGVAVALVVVIEILSVVLSSRLGLKFVAEAPPKPPEYSNTEAIGATLYTDHVYAFEIAAVILLVAIVAAITLTMRRRAGLRVQDVGRQVRTTREGRVRLVRMNAEREP